MSDIEIIYCDFDGTISSKDSVNDFFALFADKKWLEVEELWQNSAISSKECLAKQVDLLPSMTNEEFNNYVDSIAIDETFVDFCHKMREKDIEVVILSDGFSVFIQKILNRYGLDYVKFYSNNLTLVDGKFSISFENSSCDCEIGAGTCKCSKVKNQNYAYIGDGLSDLCIAKKAPLLFAKGKLQKYCDNLNISYTGFEKFSEIEILLCKGETDATPCSIN